MSPRGSVAIINAARAMAYINGRNYVIPDDVKNILYPVINHRIILSPKARTIDLMSAFFEKPLDGECDLTLKLFAPPASGENDLSIEDGLYNSYTTIEKLPNIRVRFEPVEP